MTLILTYLSADAIVQVSDSRIIRRGAVREREDNARKLLHYVADDAQLEISYTGLAEIHEFGQSAKSIENWLADAISESRTTRTDEMLRGLATRLNQAIEASKAHGISDEEARLSVIFAGFIAGESRPFVFTISNFEKMGHQIRITEGRSELTVVPVESSVPAGVFGVACGHHRADADAVLAHGDMSGLPSSVVAALNDGIREALSSGQDLIAVRTVLVKTVREAADHSTDHTTSKDCLSIIAKWGDPMPLFEYHLKATPSTQINPILVTPQKRIDWGVNVPSTPRSELYVEMLQSGKRGIEINIDSVRAAIDSSPLLAQWGSLFESSGHSVDYGSVFDTVDMIRHAGILYAESIEGHLLKATKWAEPFFDDYITQSEEEKRGWAGKPGFTISKDSLLEIMLVAIHPERFSEGVLREKFGVPSRESVRNLAFRHRRAAENRKNKLAAARKFRWAVRCSIENQAMERPTDFAYIWRSSKARALRRVSAVKSSNPSIASATQRVRRSPEKLFPQGTLDYTTNSAGRTDVRHNSVDSRKTNGN